LGRRFPTRTSLPLEARVVPTALPARRPRAAVALGITRKGKRGFALAVRVREIVPGLESVLKYVRERARGDVDLKLVGLVVKQAGWNRRRARPLRIGSSIGHVEVTAGTLGCFVKARGETAEADMILSNNHVLASENRGKRGDPVLQPGRADGGGFPREEAAVLSRFVALRKSRPNFVDAGCAELLEGISYWYADIEGRGELRGLRKRPLGIGERVFKVGRTTGLTEGRVSAIEVDDLLVGYETGELLFDGQIEIEPVGWGEPFSRGGDSGSLIVDEENRAAALLFAGNDVDATYANPLRQVLDSLGVDLVW